MSRQVSPSRNQSTRRRAATTKNRSTSTSAWGTNRCSPKRGSARTSTTEGQSSQAGTCRCRTPATAATAPVTKNQNCTWSVTVSAPPIAWNAAASRIGTTGGYVGPAAVVNTCSSSPAEEVDRLCLWHPEGPGVIGLEALEAGSAKERLEHESGERDAGRRHEQGGWRGSSATRIAEAARRVPAEQQARAEPGASAAAERQRDPPAAERHPQDEQLRPERPERGDAEQVPEPGAPHHVRPAGKPAHRPEDDEPENRVCAVQRSQPRDRLERHSRCLRIESPSASSHTTCASGYPPWSQAKQRIQGASGLSRRGRRK